MYKYEDYYEDDREEEYIHVDNLPDYEGMKSHMQKILDIIYGKGNLGQLVPELEELAFKMDIDIPEEGNYEHKRMA